MVAMQKETIETAFYIIFALLVIAALIAVFYLYAGKGLRIVI